MAITFRGTAVSSNIVSNSLTSQNLLALINEPFSRVNVLVKDICLQNDAFANLTAVSSIIGKSRITSAVSGGIIIPKCALDPSQVSDNRVIVRSSHSSGHNIIATPSNFSWRRFSPRSHTAAEQRVISSGRIKLNGISTSQITIRPGQTLLISLSAGAVAQNDMILNNWFVQVLWEEDSLSTYTIGGVVSLSGSPVNGAKVSVMEALDIDLASTILHEVKTTNALGEWSSTIVTGRYGVAISQYRVGSTYYTATSKPYLGA